MGDGPSGCGGFDGDSFLVGAQVVIGGRRSSLGVCLTSVVGGQCGSSSVTLAVLPAEKYGFNYVCYCRRSEPGVIVSRRARSTVIEFIGSGDGLGHLDMI